MFDSITFSAARTCGQEEKINVSISPNLELKDWGILPIQTTYSSSGWDLYSYGFQADGPEIDISIHNPGVVEDAAWGPLIDTVALKTLYPPKLTKANLVKNGNFEEGPYMFPNASWEVLIPPHIEDDHSPLPGWIIESLKAVKYIDVDHFAVLEGNRAIDSKGKGGFKRAKLQFKAISTRTGLMFLRTYYTMKNDNSGSLCGPVLDDVKLLSVRNPWRLM